jgi:FtsZ-interacting cell division protein ZipA
MNAIFMFGLFEGDPGPGQMSSAMKEWLIVLGAVMVVTLIALGWAILFRRKRRRAARRADRHHRRHSFAKGVSEIKKLVTDHQTRRRRHHRPRNPTLAETGGLPPVREDTSPPRTPPS